MAESWMPCNKVRGHPIRRNLTLRMKEVCIEEAEHLNGFILPFGAIGDNWVEHTSKECRVQPHSLLKRGGIPMRNHDGYTGRSKTLFYGHGFHCATDPVFANPMTG